MSKCRSFASPGSIQFNACSKVVPEVAHGGESILTLSDVNAVLFLVCTEKSPPTVGRPKVTEEKRRKSLRVFKLKKELPSPRTVVIGPETITRIRILFIFFASDVHLIGV